MLRILFAIPTYKYVESLFIQYFYSKNVEYFVWGSYKEICEKLQNFIHERVPASGFIYS